MSLSQLCVGVFVTVLLLESIVCPPVQENEEEQKEDDVKLGLEYERYLKEVVNILESDEEFRKKLEEANATDIKSGAIARHLNLVSHQVRSQLDELKRQEVERLQAIQRMQRKMKNGIKRFEAERMLLHLDHRTDGFNEADLHRLVKQASADLEDIDRKRREEFKTYELEKEHMRREKLKAMDELDRQRAEKEHQEAIKKHKQHPKMNHPGSKDQLEEVWEEEDGLDRDDFDPKTFFMLHDINSDGMLDELEVEALFNKELAKTYDSDNPEDDDMEKFEEMSRMREHVFGEVDKDKDRMISMEEFLQSTQEKDFDTDEEWEGLDDDDLFTQEELEQYERAQREYERQHAQPGEVNIPLGDHMMDPPQHPNVAQMGQQGKGQPVQAPQPGEPMKFQPQDPNSIRAGQPPQPPPQQGQQPPQQGQQPPQQGQQPPQQGQQPPQNPTVPNQQQGGQV